MFFGCLCIILMRQIILCWWIKNYMTLISVWYAMQALLFYHQIFFITIIFFIIRFFVPEISFEKSSYWDSFIQIWHQDALLRASLTRKFITVIIIENYTPDWWTCNIRHLNILNVIRRWILYPSICVWPCIWPFPLPYSWPCTCLCFWQFKNNLYFKVDAWLIFLWLKFETTTKNTRIISSWSQILFHSFNSPQKIKNNLPNWWLLTLKNIFHEEVMYIFPCFNPYLPQCLTNMTP